MTLFSSAFHIELNPSEAGIYDKTVVQEIIKELAQTQRLDKSKHNFKSTITFAMCPILVVVLLDGDQLSKDAQHSLRRTMEKFSSNLRLIICAKSLNGIIAPIKSRCFNLRMPAPSTAEVLLSIWN